MLEQINSRIWDEPFEQVTAKLGVLDREWGGMAAREMLVAVAQGGEQLLTAQCAEPVRQQLLGAVSEAHQLAGWASGDVGLIDQCRWHMHRAIELWRSISTHPTMR